MNRISTLLIICFSFFSAAQAQGFKEQSVLADGIIHQVSVDKAGIYKIDYNFLKDQCKVDPATISPDQIGIFGNGAGRLPQWNAAPRIDDLEQIGTFAVGLQDGQFNSEDYILWYAEGPDSWAFNVTDRQYNMDKNIYDDQNHYFVILNGPSRKNMDSRASAANGDYVSTNSLLFQRLEDEKVNLLGRYRPPGSGQEWYGDEMAVINEIDYTNRFKLSDLVVEDTFYYKVRFAVRSGFLTRFYIHFDEREFGRNVGSVDLGNYEASFANDGIMQGEIIPGDPIEEILVRYPDADGINSRAWVDYIQLNFWNRNIYRQGVGPSFVRDPRAYYQGTPIYSIESFPSNGQVWDITDPFTPVLQQFIATQTATFIVEGEQLIPREFICFNPSVDIHSPVYAGQVQNQNLHSIQQLDFLILYYDEFEEAAVKLAEHRSAESQLNVRAVPVSQVYKEFAGGSGDPSAMRDFARMLYKRDPDFRYMLFIGDATYDYLNHFVDLPYQNFVPAFETEESLDPIRSFPSDDYFALLDDQEGDDLIGAIDIGIGRFPVNSPEEAMNIVDKIIYYDTHPSTLHDWRLRTVMVADDEDGNVHLNQADNLAVKQNQEHPDYNIQKIYLDAYPQESTPGGDRYPEVNEDIDLNVDKGALTVTYMGHGGQNGWTQERVLGINQVQAYENPENMPLFITATCSFAGYDEPGFTTAGEHLLNNPDGGAIALMTTVRAVYSGSNERLTRAVLKRLYTPDSPGVYPTISEVLRRAKNESIDSLDINARKFTLLGDPSMNLAIPRYQVAVTHIEENPVGGNPDTMNALEKTSVSGLILDEFGEWLSAFNGTLYLTLFDKVQVRTTLANDDASAERTFSTQTRQLFKGAASVVNGEWFIEFVLPKDIDYTFGSGKLSLYAHDGVDDASGYYTGFIVGGVSPEDLTDNEPPVINLYMNNDQFVSGGITDRNPDIYAVLRDNNGINVSGTSVGHDIEATLDADDKNSLILNEFYSAFIDDYTGGEVKYPLEDLSPGLHTLKMTAWDLANNPGEASIEFLVVDSEDALISHVLNYPNPVLDWTKFQFEHNRPDAFLDIKIRVFALNGQLVKTLEVENVPPGGYRMDDLEWDGSGDQGALLAPGMYVYNVEVTFRMGENQEVVTTDAEKLVILH